MLLIGPNSEANNVKCLLSFCREDVPIMGYISGFIILANIFLNFLNAYWLTQLLAGHNRSMKAANATEQVSLARPKSE